MLLEGVKVVELATWIAGPGCAAVMADWGAVVVKVESPAGDPVRAIPPWVPGTEESPVFAMANRGKRSLVLDLTSPDDRAALLDLLADADVFVTNLRPGSLARAGLDYAALAPRFPRLVYASITGFGLEGPDIDAPAFDLTAFWTRSGVAWATIPPDQAPFTCRPGFGDHATALAALSAILAALLERSRTGRGRLVEASLTRTAAYAIGWDLSILLATGEVTAAQPRDDRPSPITGFFRTADDRWLCIVPRSDRCFGAVMRLVGRTDVLEDPAYVLPLTDLARVRELRAAVDAAFGTMTLAEAGDRLTQADVVWAPMAGLKDFVADPQADQAGCFVPAQTSGGEAFRLPAGPARFPGAPPPPQARKAPRLGEHNAEILAALGRAAGQPHRAD